MRYGTNDPILWPQQYEPKYCHMPLVSRHGARRDLDIMWWTPTLQDFEVGSAVTRGLGRLKGNKLVKLLAPINELIPRCRELKKTSPSLAITLFGELIRQVVMWVEQLETLPTTFNKMVFGLTSLQHAFLELDALYNYMTVYKQRIENFNTVHAVAQTVGTFTTIPVVAQQLFAAGILFWLLRPVEVFDAENILKIVTLQQPNFGLADPEAHADGAPPVLYSGNSTLEKIAAIKQAALHTPWYRDPFETTDNTRGRSPSPAPETTPPVASSSRITAPPLPTPAAPVASGPQLVVRSKTQQQRGKPPYPPKVPKNSAQRKNSTQPPKLERDKFSVLAVPEMPPSIACMADALANVDRSVQPYQNHPADRRYVLPEPALLVNTTPEQRRKFLHHWQLLADRFIYSLTQAPQLFSPQEWRDVLEGLLRPRGVPGSRTYRRSTNLEDRIRPALEASKCSRIEGLPVPENQVPDFSLSETQEILWQLAETNFRGMLVGVPLELSKCGWAATTFEERHCYVQRTATLMLDWTTKSTLPTIIRRVTVRLPWSASEMETLENTVCRYYTQAFWEYFGRAAVVPLRLEHDLETEKGKL
ncbi:hypothetical protein B0H10DRAFT_2230813 [Mycena sp. CBHHK59/15]|nr:hypothetical protein B0H10DRAFT_2230813 [Mycena sp. CBHHK59/15]